MVFDYCEFHHLSIDGMLTWSNMVAKIINDRMQHCTSYVLDSCVLPDTSPSMFVIFSVLFHLEP